MLPAALIIGGHLEKVKSGTLTCDFWPGNFFFLYFELIKDKDLQAKILLSCRYVQCTVYSVQCTVQCTVYSTLYSVLYST